MSSTADARALQQSIANLRGVRGAVVETDKNGRLSVRVLVVPERAAADVKAQVIARARSVLGEDVDPQRVLVLGSEQGGGSAAPGRRVLSSIATERGADGFTVKVALSMNGDTLMGEVKAPPTTLDAEVVARAVLKALSPLVDGPLELEAAEEVVMGAARMGVVTVRHGDMHLTGSALLTTDAHDMIARATLQALNRRAGEAGGSATPR